MKNTILIIYKLNYLNINNLFIIIDLIIYLTMKIVFKFIMENWNYKKMFKIFNLIKNKMINKTINNQLKLVKLLKVL